LEVKVLYEEFEISNFRGIDNLKIGKLKRINLISGKNNSGKTSLLEALFVHCGTYLPELALRINAFRGFGEITCDLAEWSESPWDSLFYDLSRSIILKGKIKKEGTREIKLTSERGSSTDVKSEINKFSISESETMAKSSKAKKVLKLTSRLYGGPKKEKASSFRLILHEDGVEIKPAPKNPPFPTIFITTRRKPNFKEEAKRYGILRKNKEDRYLLKALRTIEPRLESLSVIYTGEQPVIYGDIGKPHLISLPEMGEGIMRLQSIAAAIGNAKNGVVLIDEIENGFHFSVLKNIWKVIDRASKNFNVQIFATTHSFECIAAAYDVFSENEPYDLSFYRLELRKNNIKAISFEKDDLGMAINQHLEIR